MLGPVVLAITVAMPNATPIDHIEIEGSAWFESMSQTVSGSNVSELVGGADVGATYMPRGLRDDGAPAPLQPFLQRALRLHLDGEGYAGTVSTQSGYSIPSVQTSSYTVAGGGLHASADGYARWFYWSVAAGVDARTTGPASATETLLPMSLAAGGRIHDVLLYVGWRVVPYSPAQAGLGWSSGFLGYAFGGVEAVIARRFSLAAEAGVLDGGGYGEGRATLWLNRQLGFILSAGGGHGAYADTPQQRDFFDGKAGFDFWFTRSFAGSVTYSPHWTGQSTQDAFGQFFPSSLTHVVTLTLHGRR